MAGAFLTSREIFENPIWQDVQKFRIFFYIYGNAVFAEEGVRIGDVTIKRGQFLRSYRNLAKDLEYIENRAVKSYSISVIKRKIDSLVKENRLQVEDTELGTLFTVVNYQQYQGFEHYKKDNLEQRWNSDGTEMEQRRNNNKKDIKDNKDIKDKKNSSSTNEHEREFNEFYSLYKKKVDKKKAFDKFKLKRKKFSFEVIMKGTEAYMAECERKGTDKQYIKSPAVFLNGENFNDEYEGGGFNREKDDVANSEARKYDLPF
ncbi:replication protein [Bacillus phage Pony]|uniref:Replication protein n=1 Tax=Bacillus phage Pony TaxID=1406789 RepID=U5Q085_9CAUD|nr:DnaD-like helicase loader [Bacillus phage Pony]AGY48278.1 replication protein [Bacillus phage Pony]